MTEGVSLSPIRKPHEVNATTSALQAMLPPEALQREASYPLPMDGDLKSARTDLFSLPIVHAAADSGRGVAKAIFSPHSLLLTSSGVLLTSHVSQEEINLPLAAIFDIFPVPHTEDSEHLFLTAPTAYLLQILSTSRQLPAGGSQQEAVTELTLTLALPSMPDCTRLVVQLAEARRSCNGSIRGSSAPNSVPSSLPGHGRPQSPRWPPSQSIPKELSSAASPEQERSMGLQSDFPNIYFQVVPNVTGCQSIHADRNRYGPCDLRILEAGLVFERLPSAASVGICNEGPWSVPWAALADAHLVRTSVDTEWPSMSYPQVVRLDVAHRAGLTGSTSCILHIGIDSPVRADSLLRSLRAHQQQNFPSRPLQPTLRSMVQGPSFASGAAPIVESSTGDSNTVAPPMCPPKNRASVEVSSLGAPPIGSKDTEPLHVVNINNVPVQLTPSMSNLLMSYQPEDSKQPKNFEIGKAYILLPTVRSFQRCSVLVDKLGLGVTPLVASNRLQERGRSGARAVRDAGGVVQDYILTTESIHFPISAIVDITEESELKASNMPMLPAELIPPPASQTQPSSSSTAAAPGSAAVAGSAAPAPGVAGSSGKRQLLPFARLMAPWEKPVEGEQSAEAKDKITIPETPYPHLVGVRVKGALGGRHHGGEKAPIHMRLNAQPPPPVGMVFCFTTKDAADGFMSTMLAFKKYHLSVALSTYLNTLTAVSQRQSERRGNRIAEEGVVAQRMMGQASVPSVEPPPLPPRPADLPQANRLPRMVTNDEGEVFWYIPRKQGAAPDVAARGSPTPPSLASGMAASVAASVRARPVPMPKADPEPTPSPLEASPRDAQAPSTPQVSNSVAASPPSGARDFLGSLDASSTRLQTPPRSSTPQPIAPIGPSASSAAALSPGAGPVAYSASASTSAAMTPPPTASAATLFDDDLGVVDTPAPCLASPTPTPGRK